MRNNEVLRSHYIALCGKVASYLGLNKINSSVFISWSFIRFKESKYLPMTNIHYTIKGSIETSK